ncbi:MAG: isochorismate synthase [Flavobacterium sp. BFFFF1]|uniref:chorismate-binding protein n=1 Tax=Flavobacterium sp. BFFFF1 TaxID=2015557 RepID=UPI000BC433A3|nr:chorismate-binding protein [Flavobacterium sp. BFFFF1]OYU81217.1 MAG: isochorismate synthase [Flavobacterium sp. BFFFF1]
MKQATVSLDSLFSKAADNADNGFPFVLYRKPGSSTLSGLFQKDSREFTTDTFMETGYVFAPFSGKTTLLIPEQESDFLCSRDAIEVEETAPLNLPDTTQEDRDSHIGLVNKGIDAIQQGRFRKVVLSRREAFDLSIFDCIPTLKKMLVNYPEAYVYCWFHPTTGFWFGAFSEQLLKVSGNTLYTMAVAGTQKWKPELNWQPKEREEQQFVTDFIAGELGKYAVSVDISAPYNLKAGTLAHIKTDITASLHQGTRLRDIIESLHPTPAVCGLPKNEALDFIMANENYDRRYYSGFHGELNKDFLNGNAQTDLFVNLRCMEVDSVKKTAGIYVGGGITKDSNPEMEWQETVNKSETMKKILSK